MVEVRQRTLGVAGPANTGRGWSWLLRSGGGGRGAGVDIKSNNPHLAGGEICFELFIDLFI